MLVYVIFIDVDYICKCCAYYATLNNYLYCHLHDLSLPAQITTNKLELRQMLITSIEYKVGIVLVLEIYSNFILLLFKCKNSVELVHLQVEWWFLNNRNHYITKSITKNLQKPIEYTHTDKRQFFGNKFSGLTWLHV